jgi:hypothetical protein
MPIEKGRKHTDGYRISLAPSDFYKHHEPSVLPHKCQGLVQYREYSVRSGDPGSCTCNEMLILFWANHLCTKKRTTWSTRANSSQQQCVDAAKLSTPMPPVLAKEIKREFCAQIVLIQRRFCECYKEPWICSQILNLLNLTLPFICDRCTLCFMNHFRCTGIIATAFHYEGQIWFSQVPSASICVQASGLLCFFFGHFAYMNTLASFGFIWHGTTWHNTKYKQPWQQRPRRLWDSSEFREHLSHSFLPVPAQLRFAATSLNEKV